MKTNTYHYLFHDEDLIQHLNDCEFGDNELSLNQSEDIIQTSHELMTEGFGIYKLLSETEFEELSTYITKHVKTLLQQHQTVLEDFTLENYHCHVKDDSIHYAVSSWAMSPDVISPLFDIVQKRVEKLLSNPLDIKVINHRGVMGKFIGFRIIRPHTTDHSPYHRDAWLPYWQNTVNVWIPISGFSQGNTICLLPKSHLLNDSEILKTKKGAVINGKSYHVPAAIAIKKPFKHIKPVLHAGEALLFSPYILHGNGENNHPDQTRVSIELRFCKKNIEL